MSRSTFPSVATIALLCVAIPGCDRTSRSSPADSSPAVSSPASPAPAPPEGDGLSLEDRFLALEALFDALPTVFRDRPGRPIEDLVRDVGSGIELAEGILLEDGGPDRDVVSLDLSRRGEAEFMLAHLLFVSFNRAVASKKAEGLALSDRALDLVRSAAIDLPPDSPRAPECLLLAGRLFLKRAAFRPEGEARGRDLASARECLGEFLLARPDGPDRPSIHLNVADSFLLEGLYPEARASLESALGRGPRLPGAFALEEKLFDALTGCGDLAAMEDLVRRRWSEVPLRLEDRSLDERERAAMEGWIDVAEFWLGHIQYARGDVDSARDSFLRQVARVDAKEAVLRSRGERLGEVARIFRDLRSRRLLSFLEEKQGKRPSLDFDLGELWSTPERATLDGSRGKVVAAVFRNPGDQRSAEFLRAIDGLRRRERARGLEAVVVGFLWGALPPAEQVQAMREDLERLGVSIPAGFDPGTPDPTVFRAMGAIVGSPSFIAFDRAGRIAWFLPDPRPMDAGLAIRVIERLLAEPPP